MPTVPPPYVEGHRLLEGRTVVITAAAGTGIGSAVARRCIEEGATVLVSDAHERRLAEAVEELSELADTRVASAACNVTVQDDIDGLFAAAVDQLGHIDVLINNAGLGGTADLIEMTDEQWSLVLDVTLTGTFRATRAALQHMVPRRSGVIVN
ncbi:MAG: SDR family NAD(P)-dependent oxidoreductase, partial [Acidimicrobiales bacterium]